jgi:hypothetical protein
MGIESTISQVKGACSDDCATQAPRSNCKFMYILCEGDPNVKFMGKYQDLGHLALRVSTLLVKFKDFSRTFKALFQ